MTAYKNNFKQSSDASNDKRLIIHEIILHCTRVPSANEATRVKDYFSGHYVNVQATCDASCCFTSLSVLCPGVLGESKAFYPSKTYNLVEQLPEGFYVVADNAYCLSSTLLIPYSGREKQD